MVRSNHITFFLLIQLSTRNFPHNQAVSRLIKREPIPYPITGKLLEDSCREIQYYRFYFDGLVAHMHINDDAEHVAGGGAVYVEPGNELWVMTLPSEGTAHFKRFWHGHGGPPPPFVTRRSHLS
jgi:hypothetical protein